MIVAVHMAAQNRKIKSTRFGLRAKFVLAFASQAVIIALVLVALQQLLVRRAMIQQTV